MLFQILFEKFIINKIIMLQYYTVRNKVQGKGVAISSKLINPD